MKKKITHLRRLVTMLLFVTAIAMPKMAWAEITPTKPSGEGTAENPYEIGTAAELYWFAGLVNGTLGNEQKNASADAILTTDITVNKSVLDANKNLVSESDFIEWTPIGISRKDAYTGTFDGKGYTVSGLYFNNTNSFYVGLFGCIGANGKISNVGISDSYFQFKAQGGGVCGMNDKGELQNCSNRSTVIGTASAGTGGVCGMNYGTVRECKNTGSVSGTSRIGGVCGFNYSIIENCFNEGTVSGTDFNGGVGGVCGVNNTSNCTIKSCYNTASVSGQHGVGGVCGKNYGTITNCYYLSDTATGGIEGTDVKGSAEEKSTEQFKSGEVALLLNSGKTDGSQAWYQNLSAESRNAYPVLTSTGENTVYGGYQHGETTIHYSNSASDYPHAHAYDYSATDETNGNHDKTYQGVFTWADNDDKTNATVTATFTCEVCGKIVTPEAMTVEHDADHPNTEATCTKKGYNYYKTSYSFTGNTFSGTYTQTLRALGHDMNAITFDKNEKIYSSQCQRYGCGHIGFYATSDGSAEATFEDGVYKVPFMCLNDGLAYDGKADFTVTSLEYKRMFNHDKWVAVYVPFAIDCSKLPDYIEMAIVNNFHEYEQEDGSYNVVLEVKRKTSGTIPALTPCVMRLKTTPIGGETETYTMLFSNAMFSPAEDNYVDCSSVTRYYKFTGSLAGIAANNFNGDTDFVLNEGTLHKANTETTLKAQSWYLSATDRNISGTPSSTMLRSISLRVIGDSDGEVTGIEDVHVVTEKVTSVRDGIFDLQGRRLNSEPTNGIYIKNGVKYVK